MASLFGELKRRNVFRVGVAYAIVGWIAVQVVGEVADPLGLPEWTSPLVIVLMGIGFPIALILAWAFELTPQGVKKTKDVKVDASVTATTGRKLDFAIIGALVLGLGYFVWESRFAAGPIQEPVPADGEVTAAAARRSESLSIAVLPFSNLSGNTETDAFVAGLHDDLLTQLSKINELKVISRTSVLKYAGTERSLRDIGQELGVGTLLEGGIQRAGNRVRINVQLIDSETDEHIWAETYDRVLTVENVFDIQSEITLQIASALNAALTDSEQASISARPTESLAAYDAYLNSRMLLGQINRTNVDSYEAAFDAAETAVRLDPRFAEAWAQLAFLHLNFFWYEGRDPARAEAAWAAIQRGVAIGPEVPEVLVASGMYHYWVEYNYAAAIPEFEQAIAARPGYAGAWGALAAANRRAGNWAAAIEAFFRDKEINPNNPNVFVEFAYTLLHRHRFAEADAVLSSGIRRFPDSNVIAVGSGDLAVWTTGRRDVKLQVNRRWLNASAVLSSGYRFDYVLVEGLYGERQRALNYLADWAPGLIDVQYQFWPEDLLRAYFLYHAGSPDEARRPATRALGLIETALEAEPDSEAIEKAHGIALAMLGRTEEATASARRVRQLYPLSRDALGGSGYYADAISILAMSGNADLALEWLAAYLKTDAPRTLVDMSADPAFAGIIDDPRFAALVDEFGLVPPDRGSP